MSFGENILSPKRNKTDMIIDARVVIKKLEFILSFFCFDFGK
jgi:hypothetical protein